MRAIKTKPKLLFVVHGYNNKAGVEEHVKLLVSYLRNNYQISVCFPDGNSIVLMQDGAGLLRYPGDQIDLIAPYHTQKSEWAFAQILNRVSPDIIHFEHFLNWPLSIIDQATAKGVPVVVNFHDYYALTPSYTMQGAENPLELVSKDYSLQYFDADISDYLISRRNNLIRSFRYVKKLIVPSQYLAEQLQQVFPYKFTVIENGIKPFTIQDPSRNWTGLRFGYIGTMQPQKGWEMLLEAFGDVQAEFPDAQLHIYGGVPDPSYKRPNISFHGLYKRSELPKILSNINVGVIPSLFPETYSLVLSELWQGHVVPLVSDIGAMKARVDDGINGKKFKAGDKASLVAALKWFLQNEDWKSWQLPKPRYVNAMGADYNAIYQDLLQEHFSADQSLSEPLVQNG
ncbi:MAG: glycosyltransferase [Bdellovibrionota bacterium]|jgi:glycosyltransferase involved in cell wall biosynthesis